MPKLADAILAQHYTSVIKLAAREGGVSRPELIEKLGVTRIVADKLIENTKLVPGPKVGRTEFFKAPTDEAAATTPDAPELPQDAEAAVLVDDSNKAPLPTTVAAEPEPATPSPDDNDRPDDVAAEIDGQIVKVKEMLASDCSVIAKAQEKILLHQAMLTALLSRRMAL